MPNSGRVKVPFGWMTFNAQVEKEIYSCANGEETDMIVHILKISVYIALGNCKISNGKLTTSLELVTEVAEKFHLSIVSSSFFHRILKTKTSYYDQRFNSSSVQRIYISCFTPFLFYKNTFYKNIQAEIPEKIRTLITARETPEKHLGQ